MGWFNKNKITEGIRLQVNSLNSQVSSLRQNLSRSLWGVSHDGKRDINEIYGYPTSLSGDAGYRLMYDMARHEGIANLLTFGTARTCWREGFQIFDSNDEKQNELFSDEISKLNKRGLIQELEKADILNRIGSFSVLFVGIPDGLESCEPVGTVYGDGFKSIYFTPFAYDGIQVNKTVTDTKNPRFGLPELYQVQRIDHGDTEKDITTLSILVHWTRIIHLNEGALDSKIEGMGYLEPIYNRLIDINKSIGGSSEAYFRNARGKYSYTFDKDFSMESLSGEQKEALDEGAKKFTNNWQDFSISPAKVEALNTPHADPEKTVAVALWEISGYSGYRLRILTGEGSGQLAGSEDQLSLNAVIMDRQNTFCANLVIRLFEILSMANMVKWDDKWIVKFPLQSVVTEAQQVELDNKKADTALKIAQAKSLPGGDSIDLKSAFEYLGLTEIKTDALLSGNDDLLE